MAGRRGGREDGRGSLLASLTVVLAVAVIAFSGWVVATYPPEADVPADALEDPAATTPGTPPGTPDGADEPDGAAVRVAVVGDSYTAGSPLGGEGDKAWPVLLSERADVEVEAYAVAGAGYVAGSPDAGLEAEAREVVDAWSADDSDDSAGSAGSAGSTGDVVLVLGGRSDAGTDPAEVEQAAARTFDLLAEGLPTAIVVVVGPLWPAAFPPAGGPELREAVAAAAQDAGVAYVDPLEDPWLHAGTPGAVAEDDVSPTNLGHGVIATRVREVLADEGLLDPT